MKIEIKNLILSYYKNDALNIPSIVFEGSLGITGCSGAGKSNFLKALSGLEYIKSGEIYFDGIEIAGKKPRDRGIALLSEHTPLFKNKSVYRNLEYPLKKRKESKAEIEKKIASCKLQAVNEKIKNLSKKQQTDALLARALIREPALLLIDEPVKFAPDPEYFYQLLNEYKNEKILPQLVIATYNFDDIKDLCDMFLILREGEIAAFGTQNDIKNSPDKYVRAMCFSE